MSVSLVVSDLNCYKIILNICIQLKQNYFWRKVLII